MPNIPEKPEFYESQSTVLQLLGNWTQEQYKKGSYKKEDAYPESLLFLTHLIFKGECCIRIVRILLIYLEFFINFIFFVN